MSLKKWSTAPEKTTLSENDELMIIDSQESNPDYKIKKIKVKNTAKYKVFTALMNQSGTDAPVADILENTLGPITWSYLGVGTYQGVLSEPNTGKTFLYMQPVRFEPTHIVIMCLHQENPNTFMIKTYLTEMDQIFTDGLLVGTSLEIRVY